MNFKTIIRLVILALLLLQVLHSWGMFDADQAPVVAAKAAGMGEFEEKYVRVSSGFLSRLFVGAALATRDPKAKLTNADQLYAQVRQTVEQSLPDPVGLHSERAIAWYYRYQVALTAYFELPERGAAIMKKLRALPADKIGSSELDAALESALEKKVLTEVQLDEIAQELGEVGRAVRLRLAPESANALYEADLLRTQFYRLLFYIALVAAVFVLSLFFFLFYGVVLVFRLGRVRFTQASFDNESLLWTWAIYLFALGLLGIVLRLVLRLESVTMALSCNLVIIFACLIVLALPCVFGVSWAAVRDAVGLRVRSFGGLLQDLIVGPTFYLAALVPLFLFMMLFSLIVSLLGMDFSQAAHPLVFMLMKNDEPLMLFVSAVVAVIAAPIVEEIMFRGALYSWLRARMHAPFAVASSAFVFAVVHPQGPLGVPILFVVGCFLAVLREWRGSLVAPMVFHACFNGATLILVMAVLRAG